MDWGNDVGELTLTFYRGITLLLEAGADPNAMPEKEKAFLSSNQDNDSVITPYQLAVALNDHEAIECFVQFADQKGVPLVTDAPETNWLTNMGDLKLAQHGVGLSLNCKHRLFKSNNNLLTELYGELGIRCYIANPADRENVAKSLRWLVNDALKSPIGFIWRPILDCLIQHFKDNPDFALYVSSIPSSVTKKSVCQGLMHQNIYVETGLTFERYIVVFAHEATHLFDSLHLKINRSKFQIYEQAENFVSALMSDLEHHANNNPMSSVLFSSKIIDACYKEDFNQEPMKEFFAYLLISDVIELYLRQKESMREQDIRRYLETELPNTYQWFRTHYITDAAVKGI